MIRMILLNLLIVALYLWGTDNNRYICAALWVIAPFANLALWSLVEKKYINN